MKFSKSCSGQGSGLVWVRGWPLPGDGWGRGCVGRPGTGDGPGGQWAPGGLLTVSPCVPAQLGGCGILGVGIWLAATQGNFATLSSSFPSLSAANLLIVTGTFVMAIGFVGCIGAIKENRCLLLTVSPVGEQARRGAVLMDARVHAPPHMCQAEPLRLVLGLFSARPLPQDSLPAPVPALSAPQDPVRGGWGLRAGGRAARLRLVAWPAVLRGTAAGVPARGLHHHPLLRLH